MSMNRWKVMAGVLGVSLGGLAAFAGQCPKPDATRSRAADPPAPTAEWPKAQAVKPAGSGPTVPPLPVEVPPPAVPTFDLPALPTPSAKPADPPPAPILLAPTTPAAVAPPVLDVPPPPLPILTEPKIAAKPEPKPQPSEVVPAIPTGATMPTPVIPVSGTAQPPSPSLPMALPSGPSTPPAALNTSPTSPLPAASASTPPAPAPVTSLLPVPNAASAPPSPIPSPPDLVVEQPRTTPAPPAPTPAPASSATKFRILLRVGEGEPTFEVRHGDDLILKVACEKVDIKSPEKGQGPSEVFATGKVRFVGFGAKGTCEQLSFLAGTGEVKLLGDVKVQVLDKIGRVESELSSEKVQYRLDAGNLPGLIKP